MKNIKIIWLSFILISACGGEDYSKYNNLYPPNAEISPYDNIPGLVKVTIRDEAGRILGEGDFYKGVNHGPWAEYDPATGFLTKFENYQSGLKQGLSVTFDGVRLQSKSYYNQDILHGQQLEYDFKGIISEKNYNNGTLEGEVRRYYSGGKIMEEAVYVNGAMDGLATWYDQEGNIKFRYLYDMGELVDTNPVVEEPERELKPITEESPDN